MARPPSMEQMGNSRTKGKTSGLAENTNGLPQFPGSQEFGQPPSPQPTQNRQGENKFGLNRHLNRLGLISEKDLQQLAGPPPQKKKTEWEAAWDQLDTGNRHRHWNPPTADKYWQEVLQNDSGKNTGNLQLLANNSNASIIVAPSVLHDNNTRYAITGSKQKLKSGKFIKHNINIVREELWPHLSVLKRYPVVHL